MDWTAVLGLNREAIGEGPLLSDAQDLLRSIFNAVRASIERHVDQEGIGAKLARKLAASPTSISRRPIVELASAVLEGEATARYLRVPEPNKSGGSARFLSSNCTNAN